MALAEFKLAIRRGSKATQSSDLTSEDETRSRNAVLQKRRKLKRSLSIPLENPAKVGLLRRAVQRTFDQTQSPLFQTLPLDIRLIIWDLILAHHHIHIFQWRDRLGHQVCTSAEAGHSYSLHQIRECLFRWPWEEKRSKMVAHLIRPSNLLPLLYTCRRIYSEAVDILYSKNVFHFTHPGYPIQGLPERILPHRWDLLRHVSLTWYFRSSKDNEEVPVVDQTWDTSCQILASMSNLRQLSVGLITADSVVERTSIFEMLEPLEDIKVQGPYNVYVSWNEGPVVQDAEEKFAEGRAPFVIHHLDSEKAMIHRSKLRSLSLYT